MTELYRRDLGEGSLSEAIAALPSGPSEAIALVYSARRCCFARLEGAALIDSDGREAGEGVFEARIFNKDFELRWLQSGFRGAVRRGRAVLLHEKPAWGGESLSGIVGMLARQYVVWGQGDPPREGVTRGWSSLSTARIGALDVPLAGVQQKERVILRACEYVVTEPDHGNAYIADERLLELSVYPDEAANA